MCVPALVIITKSSNKIPLSIVSFICVFIALRVTFIIDRKFKPYSGIHGGGVFSAHPRLILAPPLKSEVKMFSKNRLAKLTT